MASRYITEWNDQAGGYLRSGNYAGTGLSPAALNAALQALSNANLSPVTYGIALNPGTGPVNAPYPYVSTTAVLNFMTTALTGVRLTVPAPVYGVFGSDSFTVDPTNPLIAAAIAAATGFLSDANGNLVTTYTTGVRASRQVESNG